MTTPAPAPRRDALVMWKAVLSGLEIDAEIQKIRELADEHTPELERQQRELEELDKKLAELLEVALPKR